MKPTAKHNDEELRAAIETPTSLGVSTSLCPRDIKAIRTVLAALKSAQEDSKRLDWLEAQLHGTFLELCHYENRSQLGGKEAAEFDPAIPYYIGGQYGHKGSTLRAAIDRAAMKGTNL